MTTEGDTRDTVMKKFISILVLSALLASLLSVSALADTTGGAKVKAELLNMRDGASLSSAVIDHLPRNAFLLVEGTSNGWSRVVYNGRTGYVSSQYLNCYETLDGITGYSATVKGSDVRMRAGANTSSKVLGYYNTGDSLKVLGVSGAWLKVASAGGATGYIRSDYLSYAEPWTAAVPSVPSNAAMGEKIVATAKQYLGYPYVWAGMSPETGFDCSGFVNYVYNQHGYSLHRVAQDIYSYDGQSVAQADLQPGDILCFGYSGSSINHVGIYIGNGQFIHASTYTTGVIISELSSRGTYSSPLIGIKRVV